METWRTFRNFAAVNRSATVFTLVTITLALSLAVAQSARAQTFSVIHNFSGGLDGANPYAGVTMDRGGNLYGTTYAGGSRHLGTVYQLKRAGSGWIANGLYSFTGGPNDGLEPLARVVFGPDGSLYGTASQGGSVADCGELGCGMVFKLQPPATFCRSVSCPWTETILYFFQGNSDGFFPTGELVFDHAGNLYGTTELGASGGSAYELTPSGNTWTESVVFDFTSRTGYEPYSGLISDNAGNLYGTTQTGGVYFQGTVFRLTQSGSGWTLSVPYNFMDESDGGNPNAGVVLDQSGNIYGATTSAGQGGGGTVFELSPSGDDWVFSLLYGFTANFYGNCPNPGRQRNSGPGPAAPLTMDAAGNLYGTTACDGAHQMGNIFKLTPSSGGWIYTSLYDFTGGQDGAYPLSNVIMDESGNLYGTASAGGSSNNGVVWEITP